MLLPCDEHEGVDPSSQGQHLGTGEITGEQTGHMGINEGLPVVGWLPAGARALFGMDAFALEDVLDAGGADLDAELLQFSDHALMQSSA